MLRILLSLITVAAFCYLAWELKSVATAEAHGAVILAAVCASAMILFTGGDIVCSRRRDRLKRQSNERLIARTSALKDVQAKLNIADGAQCITELVTVVRELSERERLIADYSSDAIICLNRDLKILSINPAVRKHWHLEPAALVGSAIDKLIHPSSLQSAKEQLGALSAELPSSVFETEVLTGFGTTVDSSWTVEYSKSDDLLFIVATDISARKSVERLRRQLFSMLGHDLRVPLTAIQFTLALIDKDDSISASGRQALLDAQRSASRAINLSSDMLDLQQAEEGKLNLRRQQVALYELVSATLSEFEAHAAENGQSFEIQIPEMLAAMADEDRLKQVLANLLSNAIKFGESGLICITGEARDADVVAISVHNAGMPIKDQDRALLFQPYGQGERVTGQVVGSGLGLALCKLLVVAMSGSMEVRDSEILSGACFTVVLPAATLE